MQDVDSAPDDFWWRHTPMRRRVAPHDYPAERLAAARGRVTTEGARLEAMVKAVVTASRTPEEVVRGLARRVQDALVHPPLLQPSGARWGYWRLRRLGLLPAVIAGHEEVRAAMHQRLIMDPEVLLALGEGRCGQVAAVLCAALERAGFSARPWQLPHHVTVEVELGGEWRVIDADAFKNGVLLESAGALVTRRELERNPYLVDRFKPTGWMFRRDSVYAREPGSGRPFTGYVDFYSPEEDGQMSARYGATTVLRPPGVPRWSLAERTLAVRRGEEIGVAFASRYAERAQGYRVRCGRRSRGYAYDALVLARAGNETGADVFERECKEPELAFRLEAPGRYYVAAAAVPAYSAEFPSYLWWSDELIIDVA